MAYVKVSSSYEVYRRNIDGQFLPGGQAAGWMDRLGAQMLKACVAAAPARSGDLRRSHRWTRAKSPGGARTSFEVRNIASYAEAVHEGTMNGPMITPKNGEVMRLRGKQGGRIVGRLPKGSGMVTHAQMVMGQNGNPWLDNACAAVARRHGAVG